MTTLEVIDLVFCSIDVRPIFFFMEEYLSVDESYYSVWACTVYKTASNNLQCEKKKASVYKHKNHNVTLKEFTTPG